AVRVAQHGAVDFVESRSGNDGPDGVRVLRDVAKGIRHRDEQFLGWPFAEYEVLAQLAVNPGRRSAQQRAVSPGCSRNLRPRDDAAADADQAAVPPTDPAGLRWNEIRTICIRGHRMRGPLVCGESAGSASSASRIRKA